MTDEISEEKLGTALHKALFWGSVSIVFLTVVIVFLQRSAIELALSWENIQWGWLFLGWLCMCSALIALGKRWQVLLHEYAIDNQFLTAALLTALLLNYAIPGPFGEVAAAWFVHKRYQIPLEKGLVTGTAARLIGLATAAVGVLLVWSQVDVSKDIETLLYIVVVGVGIGFGVLVVLMFVPVTWRMQLQKKSESSGVFSLLYRFSEAFQALRIPRIFFRSAGWSVIGHLLAGLGVWMSIFAVYGAQNEVGVGFSYLMGTCIGAVAFLFPGAQLTWDASLALLLTSTTDLSPVDAGVMTAILRMEQIAMMLLGAVALVWIQVRLRSR